MTTYIKNTLLLCLMFCATIFVGCSDDDNNGVTPLPEGQGEVTFKFVTYGGLIAGYSSKLGSFQAAEPLATKASVNSTTGVMCSKAILAAIYAASKQLVGDVAAMTGIGLSPLRP